MHCNAINKSVWHIKLVPLERASKTDLDPYLSLCENLYFNTNYLPISLQWVVIIEFDCYIHAEDKNEKIPLVLCDSLVRSCVLELALLCIVQRG